MVVSLTYTVLRLSFQRVLQHIVDNTSHGTSGDSSDDLLTAEPEEEISNDDFINDRCTKDQAHVNSKDLSAVDRHPTGFIRYGCDEPRGVKIFFHSKNLVSRHDRDDHVYKSGKVRLRNKTVELFKAATENIKPYSIQHLITELYNCL